MTNKKRVLSFDVDGSLFHLGYILANDKKVIEHNQAFFEKIKGENKNDDNSPCYDKVVCLVGSNRQSKALDDSNRSVFWMGRLLDKGSCFPALREVCEHLGAIFDPILLADIFADLPNGEALRRATMSDYQGEHPQTYFDASKVALLYAQIHKMAMDDPTAEIFFDFYDDKPEILDGLILFFKRYPELIPQNLILRLHQYNGNYEFKESIKGTGFIDCNYRQTVKDMIYYCFEKMGIKPTFMEKVYIVSTTSYGPATLTEAALIPLDVLKNRIPFDTSLSPCGGEQLDDAKSVVLEADFGTPSQSAVFMKDPINPFFASSATTILQRGNITTDPGSTMGEHVSTENGILFTTTVTSAESSNEGHPFFGV